MSLPDKNSAGDLAGRVAVVIGGTSGIGREVATQLSGRGAAVTIVGRDHARGNALARQLGGGATFVAADVSLLAECRRLASLLRRRHDRIDILIHSADVILSERRATGEGLELAFATNYLSRFLLNALLLDVLEHTALAHGAARIIHVAAAGFPGRLDLTRVPPGPRTSALEAHNLGQRANDVYAVEAARRLRGTGVSVYVAFPGLFVDTGIRRENVTGGWRPLVSAFDFIARPFMRSVEAGARYVIQLAASGGPPGAVLIRPNGRSLDHRRDPRYAAELGQGLWDLSARLTGV